MKGPVKDAARAVIGPLADGLAAIGVSPNHLTVAGLVLSAGAGAAVAAGRLTLGAVLLILGGVCDMLDGSVARRHGHATRFGAFLDSTVDRAAELLFFAGLAVYFHRVEPSTLYLVLTGLALGGSFLISYARARAEGLGLECQVGLLERPERLVLLIVALFVGPWGLRVALWILTPLAYFTTWQRIAHVRAETADS